MPGCSDRQHRNWNLRIAIALTAAWSARSTSALSTQSNCLGDRNSAASLRLTKGASGSGTAWNRCHPRHRRVSPDHRGNRTRANRNGLVHFREQRGREPWPSQRQRSMHSGHTGRLDAPDDPLNDAIEVTDGILSSRVLPQPMEESWGLATCGHWPSWFALQVKPVHEERRTLKRIVVIGYRIGKVIGMRTFGEIVGIATECQSLPLRRRADNRIS